MTFSLSRHVIFFISTYVARMIDRSLLVGYTQHCTYNGENATKTTTISRLLHCWMDTGEKKNSSSQMQVRKSTTWMLYVGRVFSFSFVFTLKHFMYRVTPHILIHSRMIFFTRSSHDHGSKKQRPLVQLSELKLLEEFRGRENAGVYDPGDGECSAHDGADCGQEVVEGRPALVVLHRDRVQVVSG